MVTGLLETTILVDLLRHYAPAKTWIATQPQIGVTPIVWLELLQGARDKVAQQKAFTLLRGFDHIEIEYDDFAWAIQALANYHLSHHTQALDALIAAPSHRLKIPLYTHNLKHFSPLLGQLAQKPY